MRATRLAARGFLSPPPVLRGRVRVGVRAADPHSSRERRPRRTPTPALPRSTGGGGKRDLRLPWHPVPPASLHVPYPPPSLLQSHHERIGMHEKPPGEALVEM